MRSNRIKVFYTEKQVCQKDIAEKSYSKSPLKPMLLMKYLKENGFSDMLDFVSNFRPFGKKDFNIAHTPQYINNLYKGKGNCRSNNLPWSKELVESVQYTTSSLYHAIRYACKHPETITFSPTSGFHHARPDGGCGFCTLSGQVIASTKLYREAGLVGIYLDLDGHYGNSIPDSRAFVKDLDEAILYNINPTGRGDDYVIDFSIRMESVRHAIRMGMADYVVWCHGADSHSDDDMHGQCTTEQWIQCAQIFYRTMQLLDKELGKCTPIILSLFGGYRSDDYESVLSLHTSDIREGCRILLNKEIEYKTKVKSK